MLSVALPVPTLSAGIDWITCTARSPAKVAALLSLGKDLIKQEVGTGGKEQPWYFQGFSGHSAGSVSAGYSGIGACVRASGAAARECAKELIECADNVSRLDVQTTVRSGDHGAGYASDLYRSITRPDGRRGRQLAKTLITSTYSGDTMYLGRRISDMYGRVYNKSAEDKVSEDPPRWRYEVEFKRKVAQAQAQAYAQAESQEEWCTSRVYHWFKDRSVTPPFGPLASCSDSGNSRGSPAQSNQLQWLKVGVRPVVQKLAAEYGWPDVLAILGVPMSYTERYVNEILCEGD